MTVTENAEERGESAQEQDTVFGMEKNTLVRLMVLVVFLWLVVLLSVVAAVGVYTSQANHMIVMSGMAVFSVVLGIASWKLNAITSLSKVCLCHPLHTCICHLHICRSVIANLMQDFFKGCVEVMGYIEVSHVMCVSICVYVGVHCSNRCFRKKNECHVGNLLRLRSKYYI